MSDKKLTKEQRSKQAVRELVALGKADVVLGEADDKVMKYGLPRKGLEAKALESRMSYLWGGLKEGVVLDGYLIINDKDIANEVLMPIADRWFGKRLAGKELSQAVEKAKVDFSGGFPDYKKYLPEKTGDKPLLVVGHKAVERGIPISYLSDGDMVIGVNTDKLAFMKKHLPDAKMFGTDPSSPIVFKVGGRVKGTVMPMFIQWGKLEEAHPDIYKAATGIKKGGLLSTKAIAELVDEIKVVQKNRTQLSLSMDERQLHRVVVEPTSPRVKRWLKDQGSMDVVGIDTPPGYRYVHKHKKKVAKRARRRQPRLLAPTLKSVRR